MHFDRGGVQLDRLDADAHHLLSLEQFENLIQHALLGPAIHAGINGMPGTETLRQSAPLAAVLSDIEQRVEELQIGDPYVTALTGKTGGNTLILLLGDLHAVQLSTKLRVSVNTL